MRTYKTDLIWLKGNWKNLALIIVGIAFVASVLKSAGTDNSKSLNEWKNWQKTAQAAVDYGNKKEKEAAKLKQKQQAESVKVAKLEKSLIQTKLTARECSKKNSALYTKLAASGALDTMLVINRFKPVITLAKDQKIEIDTLKSIVKVDSTIISSQKLQIDWLGNAYMLSDLRGDSLETVIKNQPTLLPTECKFLKVFNCPSRKQAAILGVIGGVGAVVGGKIGYEIITK
jgi:hypothetical protein